MKAYIKRLPKQFRDLLYLAGKLASQKGMNVYLVGGCVRDLILGAPNLDLDIVVQPECPNFTSELAARLNARMVVHQRFKTATLITPRKIKLDIATARSEIYPQPASLPVVIPAGIKEDLARRDFTINALAIDLLPDNFGGLVDFYNGRQDLEKKLIRILHDSSFIDDPTRIIRAVRFEQRLKFKIEPYSLELLKDASGAGMLNQVSPHRLRDELMLILKEEGASRHILRLNTLAGLDFIHSKCELPRKNLIYLSQIEKEISSFRSMFAKRRALDTWLMYLTALLANLSKEEIKKFSRRFGLRKGEEKRVISFKKFSPSAVLKLTRKNVPVGEIYKILEPLSFEVILLIKAKYGKKTLRLNIENYLRHHNGIRLYASGNDLNKLGLLPGAYYKRILNQLLHLQLEGKISSRRAALSWIRRFKCPRN